MASLVVPIAIGTHFIVPGNGEQYRFAKIAAKLMF